MYLAKYFTPCHPLGKYKLRYLDILRVKCYNGISVRLRIYSINVKTYQHAFMASLPGTNNPSDDAKKCQQASSGTVAVDGTGLKDLLMHNPGYVFRK
jgi:hypothetical protein